MTALPTLSRLSEKDLERLAFEALRDCGLAPEKIRPVPVDLLVERRFGFNETYVPLDPGVLGEIRFDIDGPREIRLAEKLGDLDDPSRDIVRRRVLAHECGHGLAHGPAFARSLQRLREPHLPGFEPSPARITCREAVLMGDPGELLRSEDGEALMEWQADRVMHALLMPRPAVVAFLAPWLRGADDGFSGRQLPVAAREEAAHAIAERFEAPLDVARRRLQQLFPAPIADLFHRPGTPASPPHLNDFRPARHRPQTRTRRTTRQAKTKQTTKTNNQTTK